MDKRRLKLLVVEDNPADARLIREMLSSLNGSAWLVPELDLCWADRLSSALETLAGGGVGTVLLDLSLPDSRGLDTLSRIRASAPSVPIIVLTGLDDSATALKAMRAGAQDYLAKGEITGDQLTRAIRYGVERNGVEQRLVQSDLRLRLLTQNTRDVLFMYGMDRDLQYVNPAFEELTGFNVQELEQMGFGASLHAEDAAAILQLWDRSFQGESFSGAETRILTKSGQTKWVWTSWEPVFDEQGMQIGVVGSETDITDRKKMEEELAASEAQYRVLADNSIDMIARQTIDGVYTYVSPACRTLLGYTPKELEGHAAHEFVHVDDLGIVEQAQATMLGGQQASTSTYRVKRKDGKYIWFQTRSHVLHDEVTGVPIEVHSTSHDVTRRQRAERLLNALNLADVAMGKALTPDTIFSAVAAELAKVDFYCMLFTCDESQSNLSATYLSHPRAALAAIEKFVGMSHERFYLPISSLGDYAKVVQERKTVLIDNIAELLYKAVPQLLSGLVAYVGGLLHQPRLIAAPLLMDDVVFAVLSIQSDELTEDDLPTVTAFANQMTSAWRKAKLLQDLRISLNESQKAHHDLQESLTKLRSTIDGAIETLGMTVEIRDPYTAGHQRRVADLASLIAQEMRLSEDQVTGIRIAAIVHDLGKLGVPVEILNKPGKLTDLEFTMIKTHPQMAFDLLKSIDFPWPIAQISLQHQERLDGSGYPQGLKGDAILLEARIIAVADVVEAMSSHRPYRPSLGMERTIEEITKYRGIRYDAEVVDACLRVLQSTSFFPA